MEQNPMATIPSRQYNQLKAEYPELTDAVEAVGKAVKRSGPLDEQTVQLIQLAAAAAIRSEGAVHSHTRRALEAGAAPRAIRQALLVNISTIGFPSVMAALTWAEDVLGDMG